MESALCHRSPIILLLINKITSILPHVCTLNYYQVVLFSLAFQLVFFALLRVSKIYTVASNKSTHIFLIILESMKRWYNSENWSILRSIIHIVLNSEPSFLFNISVSVLHSNWILGFRQLYLNPIRSAEDVLQIFIF